MDERIPGLGRSSTSRQWFVTLRLVEVAALALLVGTCVNLWYAWSSTASFDPFGNSTSAEPDIPFMSRVTSVVFFNDLRPNVVSLLGVAAAVALGVAVLLRGPVANARLLRWELLALWSAAMLVALVVVAFHVLALFGQDPFAPQGSDTPTIPLEEGFRPNMLIQLLGSVSWPLAGALLLAASGLWWVRLPRDLESDEDEDEDDEAIDDEHADGARADAAHADGAHTDGTGLGGAGRDGAGPDEAGRDGVGRNGAGPDHGRPRHPVGPRAKLRGKPRQRRDDDRDDVLVLDGVEQIDPVERLTPRASSTDDGGTSSGYEGYFRRL